MGVLLWNLFLLLLLALAQQDDFCGYVIIHINICMIHKVYLEMFIILMDISIPILWCEYYWIQSFLILFFMFIFAIIVNASEGWECVCIYVCLYHKQTTAQSDSKHDGVFWIGNACCSLYFQFPAFKVCFSQHKTFFQYDFITYYRCHKLQGDVLFCLPSCCQELTLLLMDNFHTDVECECK